MSHDFWMWDGELSGATCDHLISMGDEKWESGRILDTDNNSAPKHDKRVRSSDLSWIHDKKLAATVYPYMQSANEQAGWNYDIRGLELPAQLTRYSKGQFDSCHRDSLGDHQNSEIMPIKLSMSIILNDEFEGGGFEFVGRNQERQPNFDNKRGSICVFPSFMLHEVKPIVSGIRYSLVVWFVGPAFK